jgi:peptide/nickel transport system ATP-binding protein
MTMPLTVASAHRSTTDSLLLIDDLKTHFFTRDGVVKAVDGVTIEIKPGETVGVVGESGCGKSVTAHTVLRLLPPKVSRIVGGAVRFTRRNGSVVDLTKIDPKGGLIRSIRGDEIAMIFQEPMTSLSPVHTVGSQIAEAIMLHRRANKIDAYQRTVEALRQVGIGNAEQRFHEYPHQLSGGLRQRCMIAMALSCNPAC